MPPTAARLPNGQLHLNHGPIDLIIRVEGDARATAEAALIRRFQTILTELVAELATLRAPLTPHTTLHGPTAQRMLHAIRPYLPEFLTPMAAVAGAVADEMIATLQPLKGITKASINNGGDTAILLTPNSQTTALIAGTTTTLALTAAQPYRGIATSGWRGRSYSLGIADAVTVIARTAAQADAAATMIANRIDLPGHPAISRTPANQLSPDSDLGPRRVTTNVGPLTPAEITTALAQGAAYAQTLLDRGLIAAAALFLQGSTHEIGPINALKEPTHA